MADAGVYIEIDASEAVQLLNRIQLLVKPEQFRRIVYNVYKRTGRHVITVMKKDVSHDYAVKQKEIAKAVGKPKLSMYSGEIGCTIPIKGNRGAIGGMFSASGSAKGWQSVRKKYRVKTHVIRGARKPLPKQMSDIGGLPPFRNSTAPDLHNVTFTRVTKDRLPIRKIVGIAIPQMPMNRSRDAVQDDIIKFMMKRIEQEWRYATNRIKPR